MAEQIANGTLKKVTSNLLDYKDLTEYENILYSAESNTEIETIFFSNNTTSEVTFTIYVEYIENRFPITKRNYALSVDDVFVFNIKLYLKDTEKITASCSINEGIAYFINGTADTISDELTILK